MPMCFWLTAALAWHHSQAFEGRTPSTMRCFRLKFNHTYHPVKLSIWGPMFLGASLSFLCPALDCFLPDFGTFFLSRDWFVALTANPFRAVGLCDVSGGLTDLNNSKRFLPDYCLFIFQHWSRCSLEYFIESFASGGSPCVSFFSFLHRLITYMSFALAGYLYCPL